MAVVDHYDALLLARGWKRFVPKNSQQPGQRKWVSLGATMGPTDAYDAAWVDPRTGRFALLSIFHTAEEPDVQRGTFEIFRKGKWPV